MWEQRLEEAGALEVRLWRGGRMEAGELARRVELLGSPAWREGGAGGRAVVGPVGRSRDSREGGRGRSWPSSGPPGPPSAGRWDRSRLCREGRCRELLLNEVGELLPGLPCRESCRERPGSWVGSGGTRAAGWGRWLEGVEGRRLGASVLVTEILSSSCWEEGTPETMPLPASL